MRAHVLYQDSQVLVGMRVEEAQALVRWALPQDNDNPPPDALLHLRHTLRQQLRDAGQRVD